MIAFSSLMLLPIAPRACAWTPPLREHEPWLGSQALMLQRHTAAHCVAPSACAA